MRVLVTGGAGFIGSHLVDHLLGQGDVSFVIVVDNFQSSSKENTDHLKGNTKFQLIQHDIIHPLPDSISCDIIFHLACPASPAHYQKDPIHTSKTCFIGTDNVIQVAKRCNARLLFTSTSEVYGDPECDIQNEEYWGHVNPIGIRACYDEGKRCAEQLLFDYHRQENLDICVVRIFNTYGPRMAENDGRVVSTFILQALHNENLTVFGKGDQTRSFCYIDDMVQGLLAAMKSNAIGPINLGNSENITVLELAKIILGKATGSHSTIVFKPLPQDDPKQRKPDITRAREELLWQPSVDLHTGLQHTFAFYRSLSSQ